MSIYGASTDAPYEVLQAVQAERMQRRLRRHWCTECRGVTWGNSPCAIEPEPEDEEDQTEDDGDFCPGCNPEPTISELENGRCDSCGKELL